MASLSITMTFLSAGVVVLLLRGPMRGADVGTFRAAFDRALRGRPWEVRLDFADLVDIEAAAAAAVTAAALDACRGGTPVTIVRAAEPVRRRMALAGSEDILAATAPGGVRP